MGALLCRNLEAFRRRSLPVDYSRNYQSESERLNAVYAEKLASAEPERADDAYRSLKAGEILPSVNPQTIADGLRTSLGEKTFPIIQHYVKEIVTVSEEAIVEAMRHIWERMKIIVEPSSAVPFAAIASGKLDVAEKRVGIILSGGNVDVTSFLNVVQSAAGAEQ